MGPEATAELYLRIVRLFQAQGAYKDGDFPEIVIFNLPLPDVVEEEDENALAALIEGVTILEASGASFIAIPCNTASAYIEALRREASIPILCIIEETVKSIPADAKIGVLGTAMTVKEDLYGKAMGREAIYPTAKEQNQVTAAIVNILKGKKREQDRARLKRIIARMRQEGAEEVILGCTELPLIVRRDDCIDTLDILAEAVFARTMGASADCETRNRRPLRLTYGGSRPMAGRRTVEASGAAGRKPLSCSYPATRVRFPPAALGLLGEHRLVDG